MSLIKSISGIRGIIGGRPGENLTPVDVVKFTAAYAMFLKKNIKNSKLKVVVGRDARVSGDMLNSLVTSTLNAMGIDVIDAGLSTTPTVEIAVVESGANGGIILTASHNPGQWNALKLLDEHGEFLSQIAGEEILVIAENEQFHFSPYNELGKTVLEHGFIDLHIQKIISLPMVDAAAIRNAGFVVAVDAVSFLDDFKLDIYSDEIYTFTPKGDMIKLPVNSSALDFAYAIHTEIGNRSIGAKVNLTLVPLKHTLTSGDQVEIITSKKQTPLPEWLNYVITTKAKYHIKEALKIEKKKHYSDGKQKLNELFETIGIEFSKQNIKKLKDFIKIESLIDLYYEADVGRIDLNDLKRCWNIAERTPWFSSFIPFIRSKAQVEDKHEESLAERIRNKPEEVVLGESVNTDYKIATCCNPIAGDDVIGLITPGMPMLIHRANCKRAQDQMSRFGNRIVKAKWKQHDPLLFLAGIKFTSIDKTGLIYQLADIISNKYNLKIRSFNLTSSNEVSEGKIMLYVKDIANLNELISEIRTIKEIEKVSRMNPE
jgi:hypothetical protein